jgi:hypothetical protein
MTVAAPDKITISIADAFKPTLYAGEYTLTATQTLVIKGTSEYKAEKPEFTAKKTFYVAAPRFVLAPDEVYSAYPPDGQTGAYQSTLPHVVFRRKGLPWERKPWSDAPDKAPWMALLVLDESEMADVQVKTVPFSDAVNPADGVRGSGIALNDWEKPDPVRPPEADKKAESKACLVMDVPVSKFREIAPRELELEWLAHARRVATDDKEDVPGIDDGWFSVLVANRTPAPDRSSFAFVVSLEGWQGLLGDKEPPSREQEKMRLVVLARWSFTSRGPTFRDLLDRLCFNPRRTANEAPTPRDMWLRVKPPGAQDDAVRRALSLGYVPMRHLLRQGGTAVSWYRGPLVPVQMPVEPSLIYRNADEALQFDTTLGLFNVSYAAAWQLGRLLALQAPEFAGALFNWEGSFATDAMIQEADAMIARDKLFIQDDVVGGAINPARANELLQNELMTAIVVEWCSASVPGNA